MQQSTMHDLAVTLDDKPGTLAKALEAIAKQDLNVEGEAAIPCGDNKATLHICFKTEKDATSAKRALELAGFNVIAQQPVVIVPGIDRPGEAAKIFRTIADGKVNLSFTYLASNTRFVIGATNISKVTELLEKQPVAAGATR